MPTDPLDQLRAALPREWAVDRIIKQGGQGFVCLGTLNSQIVALKVYSLATDTRRIDRELSCLSEIDCPSLVKVRGRTNISLGGAEATVVAYEFLPGGDLRQFLVPNAATLDESTLREIGRQAGVAIEELWRRRIVHRDIKPDNIVVAGGGRYVVVDLGIARHLDRSNLTVGWAVPGTPGYMSPEQARGIKNLTIHSDVFSLAVTLYELAAQKHPFSHDQNRIGTLRPDSLVSRRPDISGSFASFIDQMMQVSPGRRPNDPSERFKRLRGA